MKKKRSKPISDKRWQILEGKTLFIVYAKTAEEALAKFGNPQCKAEPAGDMNYDMTNDLQDFGQVRD